MLGRWAQENEIGSPGETVGALTKRAELPVPSPEETAAAGVGLSVILDAAMPHAGE
jgi:hypothetical protein